MISPPLPRSLSPASGGPQTVIHLVQGEFKVSSKPEAVLATILGSCVAACLHDPVAGIGGMNHFLLPGVAGQSGGGDRERYGVHAMEMLINALLQRGADRRRFEIKLFGGAKTVDGLADIGDQNARFARAFAEEENIPIVSECLGGVRGRRIQFWPATGRARRSFLPATDRIPVRAVPPPAVASGTLELF